MTRESLLNFLDFVHVYYLSMSSLDTLKAKNIEQMRVIQILCDALNDKESKNRLLEKIKEFESAEEKEAKIQAQKLREKLDAMIKEKNDKEVHQLEEEIRRKAERIDILTSQIQEYADSAKRYEEALDKIQREKEDLFAGFQRRSHLASQEKSDSQEVHNIPLEEKIDINELQRQVDEADKELKVLQEEYNKLTLEHEEQKKRHRDVVNRLKY